MELSPFLNHWWHVTLYVTPRGLTTSAIPYSGSTFEVTFDFIEHTLFIRTSAGTTKGAAAHPRSVACFYRECMDCLHAPGTEANYPCSHRWGAGRCSSSLASGSSCGDWRFPSMSLTEELRLLLHEWEGWCVDLLESHLSYPVLTYYRSLHEQQSWVKAFTVILDTCVLIWTCREDAP